MTAEDHLRIARQKQEQSDQKGRRRARVTAVVLMLSTIISLVFLMFGYVQKTAADQLRIELEQTRSALERCQSAR